MNEDLYLNFAQMQDDKAVIQAYVFPLVCWIWAGGIVLIFGTLIALVPSKIKLQYARTEVLGITKKYVSVERQSRVGSGAPRVRGFRGDGQQQPEGGRRAGRRP